MKIKLLLTLLLTSCILPAQNFKNFKVEVLLKQLPYANKHIKATFENGKMYYYNTTNNQKLFSKGFDNAYPFFLESALVKVKDKYGVIDKKGIFLIEPIYNDFSLAPYDHESYIIIFDEKNKIIFNLNRGIIDPFYTICEEPASPELYAFIAGNKKMGVKVKDSIFIKPVYDTIYAVEQKFIIASKNKKIGVVNLHKKQLVPFKYDEVQYSKDLEFGYTYPIYGLKKNKTWTYFENDKKLLNSKYKCNSFSTLLDNTIGIFKLHDKQNILFKNGKTLNKFYDIIYKDGLIGVIDNKIFRLHSNGSDTLYYQEN